MKMEDLNKNYSLNVILDSICRSTLNGKLRGYNDGDETSYKCYQVYDKYDKLDKEEKMCERI